MPNFRTPVTLDDASAGAVEQARFVGATTSGPPASGTYQVGDYIVDRSGTMWICTAAGTPGTWGDVSSGRELGYAEDKTARTIGTTEGDYPSLTITFTAGYRPVTIEAVLPVLTTNTANVAIIAQIYQDLATDKEWTRAVGWFPHTSAAVSLNPKMRAPLPGAVLDLTPGSSYTFKLRWVASAASTITSNVLTSGNTQYWPWMRVVEN